MKNTQNIIFSLIFWLFALSLTAAKCYAVCGGSSSNRTAASCSRTDVGDCVNVATDGDTINIPACNASWSTALTISKSMTLRGAGVGLTKITNTIADTIIIAPASDVLIRITGIYFDKVSNVNGSGRAININGKTNGSYGLTKIRIDNNTFNKGNSTVWVLGWVEGVIDHNSFINCDQAVFIAGDNDYSWGRPIEAGTSHALFIEDNTFLINNSTDREPNQAIYHQNGGRTVTRYNTFDGTAYTNGNSSWYDSHGNWGTVSATPAYRGQPILEVYNNVMTGHHSYDTVDFRGGSVIFYNNTMSLLSGGSPFVGLREEEAWTSGGPFCPSCPVFTVWPAWDNLTNSFFWNNLSNGVLVDDSNYASYIKLSTPATEVIFMQKDRDYFVHAPQSTGGKTTYPTVPGKYDMTLSGAGVNAYYSYTPYTYPHPLTLKRPMPPTSLGFQ